MMDTLDRVVTVISAAFGVVMGIVIMWAFIVGDPVKSHSTNHKSYTKSYCESGEYHDDECVVFADY